MNGGNSPIPTTAAESPGSVATIQGTRRLTVELATSGLGPRFGSNIAWEYLIELKGLRGVRLYNEMRLSEPSISTGLRAIKWILSQVKWTPITTGSTPADEDARAHVESCMRDMSHTWTDGIRDSLTCLDFGWAFQEVVYKFRHGQEVPSGQAKSLFDDGLLGWRKLVLVGQDTLDPIKPWEIDDKGGIHGLNQQVMSEQGLPQSAFIPIEKALLFRLDREQNYPEGRSLLRPAYRPWHFKRQIEEIEAIGVERDATGVLIISLPVGATTADKNNARAILEGYKADDMLGFIAPRSGEGQHERFNFDLLSGPGARQYDTNVIIRRYAVEISRTFLTQFLMLGDTSSGSRALSRDHRDLFHMALRAILVMLGEILNRFLIRPLVQINGFPVTVMPEIVPSKILPGDMATFAEAMFNLVQAGLLLVDKPVRDLVREAAELPPESDDLDEEPPLPAPTEEIDEGQEAGEFSEVHPDDWAELTADEEERFGEVAWESDHPDGEWENVQSFEDMTGDRFLVMAARRKQSPLQLLRRQMVKASGRMEVLTQDYASGAIDAGRFMLRFQSELTDIEQKALQLSQKRLTPKTRAINRINRQKATDWHNRQLQYFRRMLDDLPNLSDKRLAHRSQMYLDSAEGLYHDVVSSGLGEHMEATWMLGSAAHCATCMAREGEVWPANQMPYVPRDGSSQCLSNCHCWLKYRRKAE